MAEQVCWLQGGLQAGIRAERVGLTTDIVVSHSAVVDASEQMVVASVIMRLVRAVGPEEAAVRDRQPEVVRQ